MAALITIGKPLVALIVLACALAAGFILVLVAPVIFCYVLPIIIAVVLWRTFR